jgi:phytoene dehydrogenase-like protein
MAGRYDAVIVGGGHNGLVCAAYLAKAGRKVLVLERRHVLGGAAVTEELYPGFKFSVASYVVSLFRPHIIRELDLARHGLSMIPLECSFTPHLDGPGLVRWPETARTRREIARLSPKDAEIYPEFSLAMTRMAYFIKQVIDRPAPDPTSLSPGEIARTLEFARSFGRLDPDLFHLHTQLLTMSAVDFLSLWFESEVLMAPMAVSGIIGTFLGVRSPGTAYVLLHHYMGEIDGAFRSWGFHKGGTGGLSLACARAAQSFGAEIRTQAPVARVLVKDGRARGVVLDNGDEIAAGAVFSNLDPHRTFLKLVDASELDSDFLHQIRRYKLRGSSGKVNLALDRFPEFTCRPGVGPHVQGDLAIAPDLDYLERAFDDAKYGDFSRRPYLNIVFPSLVDPTVAPPGKHVMSIFVQYAPYHIKEGAAAWPSRRDAFGDAVIDTVAQYAPTLKDAILYKQVLTPWDLEQTMGLSEGNIFHGELSIEQLMFMRPAAGFARYRTPIRDLWLCGSGAHPGGGIMGSPGELAAKTALGSGAV